MRDGWSIETLGSSTGNYIRDQNGKRRKSHMVGKVDLNNRRNGAQACKTAARSRVAARIGSAIGFLLAIRRMDVNGAVRVDVHGRRRMVFVRQAVCSAVTKRKGHCREKKTKAIECDKDDCRSHPNAFADARQHGENPAPQLLSRSRQYSKVRIRSRRPVLQSTWEPAGNDSERHRYIEGFRGDDQDCKNISLCL